MSYSNRWSVPWTVPKKLISRLKKMKERAGNLRKPKVQKHIENLPKSIAFSVSQTAKGMPSVASLATFICERKLKLPVLAYLF